MKILTTCSDPKYFGHVKLRQSLEKFGYTDIEVIVKPFQFGRQMQIIYDWCKKNQQEVFIYTDAYDTTALAPKEEMLEKLKDFSCEMLVSAEKGCYPLEELRPLYPETLHDWKYVNAGQFMTKASFFIEIFEDGLNNSEKNDQAWLSKQFLKRDNIHLDTECKIFQSIAFEGEGDFFYEENSGRLINAKTGERPCFCHSNGGVTDRLKQIWSQYN